MNTHRLLVAFIIGLAVLGAVLVILSIWGVLFDSVLMMKVLGTIGVLILLAGFLLVVKADFSEHKRLKDQNYID